jgi:hypothetical protein
MKTNSYIKFTNIIDLIQLYFDSIDLPKVIVDSAKPTLRERENNYNGKLQKYHLARRHYSINWRWQSQLVQWLRSQSFIVSQLKP